MRQDSSLATKLPVGPGDEGGRSRRPCAALRIRAEDGPAVRGLEGMILCLQLRAGRTGRRFIVLQNHGRLMDQCRKMVTDRMCEMFHEKNCRPTAAGDCPTNRCGMLTK